MSHRQKNKHKSRHRIHANNGPRVPQIGRAATGSANTDTATTTVPAATTPATTVATDTATPSTDATA